jgi:hypothetical protein
MVLMDAIRIGRRRWWAAAGIACFVTFGEGSFARNGDIDNWAC